VANTGVLVDTGPLVAILSKRDQYHSRCVDAAKKLVGPFYTCWPVVTEAAYLLRDRPDKVSRLLDQIHSGKFRILQLTADDIDGISTILKRYSDQDFDLADASLMHLASRERLPTVFTIDSHHFAVYRTSQGKPLAVIPGNL
jgi:predicted nucleic acid-binding protein